MRRIREPIKPEEDYDIQLLKELNCFEQIDDLIKNGSKYDEIIKVIRDNNELVDLEDDEIKRIIKKYKDSLAPAEVVKIVAPNKWLDTIRKIDNFVNELEELNRLYLLQMERIAIDFQNEKRIGKLFKTTGTEVWYAMKILETMANLKMDMGFVKRDLGRLDIREAIMQVETKYGEIPNKEKIINIIKNPESRDKLLTIVKKLELLTGGENNVESTVKSDIIKIDD